jgi:hypothetical protein
MPYIKIRPLQIKNHCHIEITGGGRGYKIRSTHGSTSVKWNRSRFGRRTFCSVGGRSKLVISELLVNPVKRSRFHLNSKGKVWVSLFMHRLQAESEESELKLVKVRISSVLIKIVSATERYEIQNRRSLSPEGIWSSPRSQ